MEWTKGKYLVTDDTSMINLDFVERSLKASYWADDRPKSIIEKSLSESTVLSLFQDNKQIGLARVVSDFVTFAWLCDVVVDPQYRGEGLGKWIIDCCLEHPSTNVRLVLLATRDAQTLYEKFGFIRRESMILRREYPD